MMRYLLLLFVSLVVLTLPLGESSVEGQGDPEVYRALILKGSETSTEDATELVSALETPKLGSPAVPWYSAVNGVNMESRSWNDVRDVIKEKFEDADANDVSLIFLSTSGGKVNDTNDDDADTSDEIVPGVDCDTLPCDEVIFTENIFPDQSQTKVDDPFDDLFQSFQVNNETGFDGRKIIVISSCYSGGLADGDQDLPVANSVVLMASETNDISRGQDPAFQNENHKHMWFPGFLIAGLANNGSGKARADLNGNNEITVEEWLTYAEVKVLSATAFDQEPQGDFVKGSGFWPVLKYNDNTLIQHSETPYTGTSSSAGQCVDAPVGGIAEALPEEARTQAQGPGSSGTNAGVLAGVIAGAVAAGGVTLGGVAWYVRRRVAGR